MADESDRLAKLEARLQALEGGGDGGESKGDDTANADQATPEQAALVQAFLQGALIGNAGAQASTGEDGATPAFASIWGCGRGRGWSPTHYDSIFWCKSRFMCNQQSLSCLC